MVIFFRTLAISAFLLFSLEIRANTEFFKHYPLLYNIYKALYLESREKTLHSSRIHYILDGIVDKKNPERLSTFVQALQTYQQQSSSQNEQENALYKKTELLVLSLITIHQITRVQEYLLPLLATLFSYKEYWQSLNTNSLRKNITQMSFGFNKKESSPFSTETLIKKIEEEIYKITYYLGYLYNQLQHFGALENEDVLQLHLIQTTAVLQDCLENKMPAQMAEYQLANTQDTSNLHTILLKNWRLLATYSHDYLASINSLKKPSYLRQNAVNYTLGTLGLIGLGYYIYQNKETVIENHKKISIATTNFYKEYVLKSLKECFDDIVDINKKSHNPPITPEMVEKSESKLLDSYAIVIKQTTNEDLSREEIQMMPEKPDLEQLRMEQMNHWPTTIAYSNTLGPIINTEFQEVKIHGAKTLSFLFEILKSNWLTFKLITPTYIGYISYIAYKITNSLYHKYIPHKKSYISIHTILLTLERILNKYNKTDQKITFDTQGLLLYWIDTLTHYKTIIPSQFKGNFEEDLQEISCPDYTITQKLRTISRMYRTYPFLMSPGFST